MKLPEIAMISLAAGLLNSAHAQPVLREAFKSDFLIGAALNEREIAGRDGCAEALIPEQFNSISPENVLKWARIHPRPEAFNFGPADEYVEFGRAHRMFIVGHTLIWHNQTPRWVFRDDQGKPASRELLLERMKNHITTVVGRYKGRINGWDVVNEALNDDGSLRHTPWLRIIGEDYLVKAFQFAHEADPQAELYYNDFSLENEPKRNGAVALIKKLQAAGVPVAGVGLQGHYKMDWPTPAQLDDTVKAFAALGVKVMITELDVDVLPSRDRSHSAEVTMNFQMQAGLNPYTNGLPDTVQRALAERYAELFEVFVRNRARISRVTFWGVTDATSWLNNWPIRGRTSYPLLFDRDCKPKPAFYAVIKTAGAGTGGK